MRSHSVDDEFEAFFNAHAGGLERFATMLVGDPVQGAELAQEALVRVYARWGRVSNGTPTAYARTVVLNLVRSAHRARRVRRAAAVPDWAARGDADLRDSEGQVADQMRVVPALQQLSPVRRATVLLRFYEDRSIQEVARLLGRPEGTVQSDIHRALNQLRPLLEEPTTEGGQR